MRENSKHTCDERYLRTEAKIQNTIDTMLINKRVVTKVRDFCVSAGINPATFYGHYESIGDVFFERDRREAESLRQYLFDTLDFRGAESGAGAKLKTSTKSNIALEIAFQKTFRYINDHKTYFKSITTRDNICPYKNLVITLKPALFENWYDYHKWDEKRGQKLEKVCHKLTFEVAGEYNEWIKYDGFDNAKVAPHVKHLIYLTSTACQRLDR